MLFTRLLPLSCLLPSALSAKLHARDATASFKFYAYGPDIGGQEVFYYQGLAFIGNSTAVGDDAVPVTFNNPNGTLIVTPDNSTTPFESATFYVPTSGGPSGFLNGTYSNSLDNTTTTGWSFYGQMAILLQPDGSFVTEFYASPSKFANVSALTWNVTDTKNNVPIAIKQTPPSTSSS